MAKIIDELSKQLFEEAIITRELVKRVEKLERYVPYVKLIQNN